MKASREQQFAKILLNEKIFIVNESQPFTWTSGRVMPFYCDNRALLGRPQLRTQALNWMIELIKDNIAASSNVSVVGVVTAGVPWASLCADHLNLPLGYVRSQKKSHGKKNAVEGEIDKNVPVILIEDLVSTGKSLVEAYDLLTDEGYHVAHCFSLFSYRFSESKKLINEKKTTLKTVSCIESLNRELPSPLKLNSQQLSYFEDGLFK